MDFSVVPGSLSRSEARDLSNDEAFAKIQKLHDTAEGIRGRVRTAHIRFRKTRLSGPFRGDATPDACAAVLAKYDLVSHPDDLTALLDELLDANHISGERRRRLSQKPWSDVELHVVIEATGQMKIRETRHRPNGAPVVHVIDGDVSVVWDEANSQMNIDSRQNNRIGYTRLSDFLAASTDTR